MQYKKVASSLRMAVAVALSTCDRLSNRFRWRSVSGDARRSQWVVNPGYFY